MRQFLLSLFPIAHAQDINLRNSSSPYNRVFNLQPQNYVMAFINIALGAAGVLSFIFLLVGGIQWITAGGDKDGVDKGRKKISGALIGLAVVFSVYAVAAVINVLFGINIGIFQIPNI